MSTRTVVYKGLLLAGQVGTFYKDLTILWTESALAMVHQRFSTNTFPVVASGASLPVHIAHNVEINTVRGNVNWMKRAPPHPPWRAISWAPTSTRCGR